MNFDTFRVINAAPDRDRVQRAAEKAQREPLAQAPIPRGLRPAQREGESREVYRARVGLNHGNGRA